MPEADPVAQLYVHLLRSAAHAPGGLLDAASGRAEGDELLTAALLARPEVDAHTARRLAGPVRGRTVIVWLAYLGRPELTDDDRVAALRPERRGLVRRALAGSGRTPPAVLTLLGADNDRQTRLAVLGNTAAPGTARLSVLAGFDTDLRAGTPPWRNWKAYEEELEEITSALRSPGFDPLADDAILQTTHPKLLTALVSLRDLTGPVAEHVAEQGILAPLAALPERSGRKRAIEAALNLTHRLLIARRGDAEPPGLAALRDRLRAGWAAAGLSDTEIRGVHTTLARVGIRLDDTEVASRPLAEAVAWAGKSTGTSAQLTETVLAALGDDGDAWRAFDAIAPTMHGPLTDTLLAAHAVGSAGD